MANPSEMFARHRINSQLKNLGWIVDDSAGRNVYLEGETKTKEQKRALNRSRPDYILYETDSIKPIAIIEAKRPRENLEQAFEKGHEKAKKIGARLIFASDSYITQSKNTNGSILKIDGEPLQNFIDENTAKKFLSTPNLITESRVLTHHKQLVDLFKRADNLLRKDGMDAGLDSLYEFCMILFVKLQYGGVPDHYLWDNLITKSGNDLLQHYKNTISYFKKEYKDVFREIAISNPETLERIISPLKKLDLSGTDIDIKGGAYEHFLSRYSAGQKSVLGQHFTPRHIVKMMATLLKLEIKENIKIYDPFCGTGGMLVECYNQIYRNIPKEDRKEKEKLDKETLYGRDIALGASRLAKMNMILRGDGHSNIEKKDSLANPVRGEYDVVITNIPFNLEPLEIGGYYDTATRDANDICIRHCIKALKKGGRACIVIPENICYEDRYEDLRNFIIDNCQIEMIIRLPRATFKKYATARTAIIYLTHAREIKTKGFFYIDIKNDGYSEGRWREPTKENDINKLLAVRDNLENLYQKINPQQNNRHFFPIKKITAKKTGGWELGELLELKTKKINLDPDKNYREPRLSSETNTIPKHRQRQGSNISGKQKTLIEKGDLVISTLHTQAGNGLWAISDDEYIATSQIVARINTDLISKEYLCFALRQILPLLEKNDLTGRETYKPEEILSLYIPKPPKEFRVYAKEKRKLENDIKKKEREIIKKENRMKRIFNKNLQT